MADIAYGTVANEPIQLRTRWGAIWAGFFAFISIWSVFGLLGEAVFASAATPAPAKPIAGMSVGPGIWEIVLTVVAMYVGGKVTGRLAAITNRMDAMLHGLAMFGLAVFSTAVVLALAGTALAGGTGIAASMHSNYLLGVFVNLGWWGVISLFLGWLSVLVGATSEVGLPSRSVETPKNVRDIRAA
jgi:hypothetical protein